MPVASARRGDAAQPAPKRKGKKTGSRLARNHLVRGGTVAPRPRERARDHTAPHARARRRLTTQSHVSWSPTVRRSKC